MFSRILVPTDGSESALKAVRVAARLAAEQHAEVVLLTAVPVPQSLVMAAGVADDVIDQYIEDQGAAALASGEALFQEAGVGVETKVVLGSAAEVIVNQAHVVEADLVVMGKRGHGELRGLLLGSVSARVAHQLTIPVLLVP